MGKVISVFPPDEAARLWFIWRITIGGPDNISAIVVRVDEAVSKPSRPRRSTFRLAKAYKAIWGRDGSHPRDDLGFCLFGAQGQRVYAGAAFAVAGFRNSDDAGSPTFGCGQDGGERPARASEPEGKLQSGPYQTCSITEDKKFVSYLAEITDNLYAKGTQDQWPVEWSRFSELRRAAEERIARETTCKLLGN